MAYLISCLTFLILIEQALIAQGTTLQKIQKRGYLSCGVSQGLPGFSTPSKKNGHWEGLDADFCRSVAAASLGSSDRVRFRPLSAKERFTALQSGEVDLLSRTTTWTLSRDSKLGFDFIGVSFYDGQSFMVRKQDRISKVKDLAGATICVNSGTTTELNVADYFASHNLKYKLLSFEKSDEVVKAYERGRCDAYTTDRSGLYANLQKISDPSKHEILSETISREPLGPVVRHGDNQWADIVRWTLFVLISGEHHHITQKNIDSLRETTRNPEIQRILGIASRVDGLPLKKGWGYRILKQVGNYQEVYERNLGSQSKLKIKRTANHLWKNGGLHYPMPFR